ncbi:MAG: hypothetical protein B7733_01570 [Myxococcales bacterium FL481]|nr:MAG: hypothetical protein B7733_01570 [Myxococcales bacterium FL481]
MRSELHNGMPVLRPASLVFLLLAVGCADDSTNGGENHFDPDAVTPQTGDEDSGAVDPSYAGGWEVGPCQDAIVSTVDLAGSDLPLSRPGDVLLDFRLVDQFGERVRLYDFCHVPVYLEWAALW